MGSLYHSYASSTSNRLKGPHMLVRPLVHPILLSCFALSLTAVACGGSGTPSAPGGTNGGTTGGSTGGSNPTVASVVVTGATAVELGGTLQLSAEARDASGAPIGGKTVAWSSSSDAVASVASTGVVTARAAGTAQISAAVDGKSGSLAVTVTPPVGSVTISGSAAVQAGATTRLSAQARDAVGNVLSGIATTWSTADPTILTVAGDGTVTALRIGTVNVTATMGSKTASVAVVSSLSPFVFTFTTATSAADQQLIKDAVQLAHGYFRTALGRNLQSATVVAGAASDPGCDTRTGNAAVAGAGSAIICVNNSGWLNSGPVQKQKIVVRELFHVLQYANHWLGIPEPGAQWLIDGSAELVGFRAIADKGTLPIATARGCQVKLIADFTKTATLLPLNRVELLGDWQSTQGPILSRAVLGVDQLTATSGLASLMAYADALSNGTPWQTAFQTVFGQSLASFYAQYPAYESGLAVPATYACGV
ncbi:MAG: Ig protein [Gemmatimonadetes bacterium]|nr:Ig protein [Gemmatimonadota bacterium]